jgi:hypothetical protein
MATNSLPDTAMGTGNDDGRPGERLGGGPLDDQEHALLDKLRHDDRKPVVTKAEEDTRAMWEAVEDDSVVLGED